MTFEVEVNGRRFQVAVEPAGEPPGRFRVTVDGHAQAVDAQRTGEYGLSLLFPDAAGASSAVQIAPGPTPGELLASLGGSTARVVVNGRRRRRPGADDEGGGHGQRTVVAPMSGRVVRVLVAPGDEVRVRQALVVVEAMKMENELRSPKTGRVKEVSVSAGMSVEAGRALVVVE